LRFAVDPEPTRDFAVLAFEADPARAAASERGVDVRPVAERSDAAAVGPQHDLSVGLDLETLAVALHGQTASAVSRPRARERSAHLGDGLNRLRGFTRLDGRGSFRRLEGLERFERFERFERLEGLKRLERLK